MQLIIQELSNALSGNLGWYLGAVLLGLLLLYTATLCLGALLRLYGERKRAALAAERMRLEIELAKRQILQLTQENSPWNGIRKFRVLRKITECEGVESFYLAPHDGKTPLPLFKPGQYLTFQLNIPGQTKPVIRCYSLSDSPSQRDYYRVTIKKVCPTPDQPNVTHGLASCHFCDRVQVGDILGGIL